MLNPKLQSLLHILGIAPLFWAIGTNKLPQKFEHSLAYIAIGVFLWHSFRIYKINRQKTVVNGGSTHSLATPKTIAALHVVVVAPLLYLIGSGKIPYQYKRYFTFLAVIVLFVHLRRLAKLIHADKQVTQSEGMNGINHNDNGQFAVHHIKMFDSSPGYSHPVLNIKAGDVVVWTNIGELDHTVTSGSPPVPTTNFLSSSYIKPGEIHSVKFTSKGEFPYYCIPHAGWMRGLIIVE